VAIGWARLAGREVPSFHGIVGRSAAMLELFGLIDRVAPIDVPDLIQGESGTGKELVARALQELGPRAGRPYEVVNCATLPRELLLGALFGHERGAFTGALIRKPGLLVLAGGGTALLDEIGELSAEAQAMLLPFLQNAEVLPVGGPGRPRWMCGCWWQPSPGCPPAPAAPGGVSPADHG
jgi:transcriptional regulator with GAF, ATPase, and Fis domain